MPEATVAAIIFTDDGGTVKILLTRRNIEPFKGLWCLPGGHVDRYETARDAIVREVKEETGLNFDARFFNYFDEIIPDQDIHAVVLVFDGDGIGIVNAQISEVTDIEWFSIDKAQSLPLAFTHNQIVDAYVAKTRKEGCLE